MNTWSERSLRFFVRIRESNQGQGFVEYLMIVGLIGIALTAALLAFRDQVSTGLGTVGSGV